MRGCGWMSARKRGGQLSRTKTAGRYSKSMLKIYAKLFLLFQLLIFPNKKLCP